MTCPDCQWRPIDTAPKDGTPIILYGRHTKTRWPIVAVGYFDRRDEYGHFGSWCLLVDAFIEPTHWLPIPSPPQETAP